MFVGIYSPDDEAHIVQRDRRHIGIHSDRDAIAFPAEWRWYEKDPQDEPDVPDPFPWPGWHQVRDFDARSALNEFVRIQDAGSALDYAKRYGPLWACTEHKIWCLWQGLGEGQYGESHRWDNPEPVDDWLGAVQSLLAALAVSERLSPSSPIGKGRVPDCTKAKEEVGGVAPLMTSWRVETGSPLTVERMSPGERAEARPRALLGST